MTNRKLIEHVERTFSDAGWEAVQFLLVNAESGMRFHVHVPQSYSLLTDISMIVEVKDRDFVVYSIVSSDGRLLVTDESTIRRAIEEIDVANEPYPLMRFGEGAVGIAGRIDASATYEEWQKTFWQRISGDFRRLDRLIELTQHSGAIDSDSVPF